MSIAHHLGSEKSSVSYRSSLFHVIVTAINLPIEVVLSQGNMQEREALSVMSASILSYSLGLCDGCLPIVKGAFIALSNPVTLNDAYL